MEAAPIAQLIAVRLADSSAGQQALGEAAHYQSEPVQLQLALNLLLGSSGTPAASDELSELAAATLALLVLVLIGSMSCDARCALVSGCHPPWPRSCAAAAGVWRQWGHGALR